MKTYSHRIEKFCLARPITNANIIEAHEGHTRDHFLATITL